MKDQKANPFKLSVWMISYNQVRFISKAIDSVLAQQTDFQVELIIGDDCSTDGTLEIIESYVDKFPDKIKLLKRTNNLGMMQNLMDTLNHCNGKFVALLEADDYWTDNCKLQKQVDLLCKNDSLAMVFHNAKVIYENNKKDHMFTSLSNRIYSPDEIIQEWKVQTATVVFRNFEIKFPEFANECVHGDLLLFLLILQTGEAFAIDNVMSVYRKSESGTTVANSFNTDFIMKLLNQLKNMDDYFNFKYRESFKIPIKYWERALITSYKLRKRYGRYTIEFIRFLIKHPATVLIPQYIKKGKG